MHARLAAALAAVLVAGGCGGGEQVTFTRANFGTLMSAPAKYENAKVDVVGQVFLVDRETPNVVWIGIYADPAGLTWEAMVEIPRSRFFVEENQLVHVVGVVKQHTQRPVSMTGFDMEPVIVASTAKVVPGPAG